MLVFIPFFPEDDSEDEAGDGEDDAHTGQHSVDSKQGYGDVDILFIHWGANWWSDGEDSAH